jgi:hypothetical protein
MKKRQVDHVLRAAGRSPLAIAKYAAGREKDLLFNRELARRGIVTRDTLLLLLDQTPIDDAQRQRARARIESDFCVGRRQ